MVDQRRGRCFAVSTIDLLGTRVEFTTSKKYWTTVVLVYLMNFENILEFGIACRRLHIHYFGAVPVVVLIDACDG